MNYALITLMVGLCYFLGAYVNKLIVKKVGVNKMLFIGLISLIIATIIFDSITYKNSYTLSLLIFSFALSGLSQGLSLSNTIAASMSFIKENFGFAASLFTFIQILFAAITSLLIALIPIHNAHALGLVFSAITVTLIMLTFFNKRV